MPLLRRDSYLEHLKPGVRLDTWCALRNNPLHHTSLFQDKITAKADEDIAKSKVDLHSPNLVWVPAGAAAVTTVSNLTTLENMNKSPHLVQSQNMHARRNFGSRSNFTIGRNKDSDHIQTWFIQGKEQTKQMTITVGYISLKDMECSDNVHSSVVKDVSDKVERNLPSFTRKLQKIEAPWLILWLIVYVHELIVDTRKTASCSTSPNTPRIVRLLINVERDFCSNY